MSICLRRPRGYRNDATTHVKYVCGAFQAIERCADVTVVQSNQRRSAEPRYAQGLHVVCAPIFARNIGTGHFGGEASYLGALMHGIVLLIFLGQRQHSLVQWPLLVLASGRQSGYGR